MSPKQVLLLFVAGVVCLIGLAGYIVSAGYLAAAIFWTYVVPILIFLGLMIYRVRHRDVGTLDDTESKRRASQAFFPRMWNSVGELLGTLQYAFEWPATLILLIRSIRPIFNDLANRKLRMREHLAAATELTEGAQFYGSTCMACLTVFWFLIVNTGKVHSIFAIWLLYVFAASVMVRQLASFWLPSGVLAGFKQAEGSPVVKFAVVLGCDVTTLVLAFSSIRAHRIGTLVHVDAVVRTAKELVSLGETVPKMIQGGPAAAVHQVAVLPRTERFVLVAGFLLYSVLIKTAKGGWKQFAREDGDYLAMARASIAKGKYEKALEQVAKVKDFSSKTEEVRLTPLLARGNVEKAKQCARRMLEMNPSFSDEVTVDDVYWELLIRASILPPDLRLKVWQAALVDAVSGSVLLLVLTSWTDEPTLLDSIFAAPAHPSQAIPFAHFLIGLEKPAEAIRCLGETMPAGLEDRVSYRSLFLIAAIQFQVDEDAKRLLISQWIGSEKEEYERDCRSLFSGIWWRQSLVFTMLAFVFSAVDACAPSESPWFKELRDTARDRLKSTEQGMTSWKLFYEIGGETVKFGNRGDIVKQEVEAAGQETVAS